MYDSRTMKTIYQLANGSEKMNTQYVGTYISA